MHDQPSVTELVEAVKHFIDTCAAPNLDGHAAFHARIASNVLAIVLRDLEMREGADKAERTRLLALLEVTDETELSALNEALCTRIKTDQIDARNTRLRQHLRQTVESQLAVDQPHYSGLQYRGANDKPL